MRSRAILRLEISKVIQDMDLADALTSENDN